MFILGATEKGLQKLLTKVLYVTQKWLLDLQLGVKWRDFLRPCAVNICTKFHTCSPLNLPLWRGPNRSVTGPWFWPGWVLQRMSRDDIVDAGLNSNAPKHHVWKPLVVVYLSKSSDDRGWSSYCIIGIQYVMCMTEFDSQSESNMAGKLMI